MRKSLTIYGVFFMLVNSVSAYQPDRKSLRKYEDQNGFGSRKVSTQKSCGLESSSYHSQAPDAFQSVPRNHTDRTVNIPINYHVIYLEGDSIYMNVTVDNQQSEHCSWDIRDYDNNTFLLYPGFGFDFPGHSYSLGGILPQGNYALFLYDEFGTGGVSATVTTSDGTVLASVNMGTWSTYTFLTFTAPSGNFVNGLVSDEIIEAQTAVLNTVYNSFGYSFYTASIDSAINSGWYYATDSHKFDTDQWDNDDQYLAMANVMTIDVPSSVNFFWTGATLTSGLGVYPWSFAENDSSHGLFCGNYTYPGSAGNFSEGYTGVHEVGHYFGLYHTFENGCTSPGDEVDDTPYQSEANFGCPTSNYSCGSYDDMGNHMDYIDDYCQDHFTQGQKDRIDWALETYRPLLLSTNTTHAGPVWHVDTTGSDSTGDGSAENPFASIQTGIDSANNGDTVLVAAGTYIENIQWPDTEGLKLIGSGPDSTIIDGSQTNRVIEVDDDASPPSEISGFTITNGNTTGKGGGIEIEMTGDILLSNLVISNNQASRGGGIVVEGIGGAWMGEAHVTVENVVFSGNHATGNGGGFYAYDDYVSVLFKSVTFANNSAGGSGGGMSVYGFTHYAVLANSILWNNSPDDVYGSVFPHYSNLNGGIGGEGNITIDPIFMDSTDFHLQEESPCIDAGSALVIINLDTLMLSGDMWMGDTIVNINPAFYGGNAPDMGAFESPYTATVAIDDDIIPYKFALHPPYPNPFNPITTIRFSVPVGAIHELPLRLHIYDITGRVVEILVDGKIERGQHEIQWNASEYSSGVYFAELISGDRRQVQKMILLK